MKMQKNCKCRFCGEKDETVNYIISKCSKPAQKEYKTKHDWAGRVIHWELCKRLNFGHSTKWYMHKPESVLKNGIHKILWDLQIQTDHVILSKRQDLVLINKKKRTCWLVDFAVPTNYRVKIKESEKIDKYLHIAREVKRLWNMKVTVILIVIGALGMVTKGLEKGQEELKIRGRLRPDYSTVENGQNTEMNHGNLQRFAVTWTPVKNYQPTLVWKTHRQWNNSNNNYNNNNNNNKHEPESITEAKEVTILLDFAIQTNRK